VALRGRQAGEGLACAERPRVGGAQDGDLQEPQRGQDEGTAGILLRTSGVGRVCEGVGSSPAVSERGTLTCMASRKDSKAASLLSSLASTIPPISSSSVAQSPEPLITSESNRSRLSTLCTEPEK
jgi:hypothetical protein